MTFSNCLSDAELERLAVLSEELGEAQHAIGKILRHGYESVNPDLPLKDQITNRETLAIELGHIAYAIEEMIVQNDIDNFTISDSINQKKKTIQKWLHHQGE